MENTRKSDEVADDEPDRRETIPLSARATHALIESYFNPREPSDVLRRAQQRYATLIVSSES